MILATLATTILSIAMVTVSVLLVGLILLQKNRGAGLSGAFGGVGGHSAFGTKTGDMLTWVTVGLAAVFVLLAIAGNYIFVPEVPLAGAANLPAPAGAPGAPPGQGQMPQPAPGGPTAMVPVGAQPTPGGAMPPPPTGAPAPAPGQAGGPAQRGPSGPAPTGTPPAQPAPAPAPAPANQPNSPAGQ